MTSKGVKKKVINNWVENLFPKLKRKTSRTKRCRLILSVERQVFPRKNFHACWWNICRFEELDGNFFGHIYQYTGVTHNCVVFGEILKNFQKM